MDLLKFNDFPKNKPSDGEYGYEFIVKIDNGIGFKYEIAEWVNPFPEVSSSEADINKEDIEEHEKPHFNTTCLDVGRTVIGYCKIYEYLSDTVKKNLLSE